MYDKNDIFEALNALSDAWKAQFDNPPAVPMVWTEKDGDGMAFLDDLEVCPVVMVDVEDLHYDVEDLWIGLVDGDEVRVHIDWPNFGEPSFFIVP